MTRCHCCARPITDAHVTVTWQGFGNRLDGTSYALHVGCFALRPPAEYSAPLPERVQDPDQMVMVEPEVYGGQWVASCALHGVVGEKDTRDDAHLTAARHLARFHVGVLA